MVQVSFLEGGDGVDPGGSPARREDDLCERNRQRFIQRGYDSHGGLQHEENLQGVSHHQTLGHRGTTTLQINVGEILQGRKRYCLHGGRCGQRQDRSLQERAAQSSGKATVGWYPCVGAWEQAGPTGFLGRTRTHRENEPQRYSGP